MTDGVPLTKIVDRPSKVDISILLANHDLVQAWTSSRYKTDETELARTAALSAVSDDVLGVMRFAGDVLFLGAHPIKLGLGPFLADLIRDNYFSHVAVNGAVLVHEWELCQYGKTSEFVDHALPDGSFGFADSIAELNEAIQNNSFFVENLAWLVGDAMRNSPYAHMSVLVAAVESATTVSAHSFLGADVNHLHDNFDPLDWCKRTVCDYSLFSAAIAQLCRQGGAFITIGSQTLAPELFLKQLSAARRRGLNGPVNTVVFDWAVAQDRELNEQDPQYYNRAWKNLLVRPHLRLVDGEPVLTNESRGVFVGGDFAKTVPGWFARIVSEHKRSG